MLDGGIELFSISWTDATPLLLGNKLAQAAGF
jgi:hypothetical protein